MLSRHRFALSAPPPDPDQRAATRPFNPFHTGKGVVILVIVIALFFTRLPKEIVA